MPRVYHGAPQRGGSGLPVSAGAPPHARAITQAITTVTSAGLTQALTAADLVDRCIEFGPGSDRA